MNETTSNVTKGGIAVVMSTFFHGLWSLVIPLAILIVCEIIDYITGIAAAENREQQVTSEKGYAGIMKKVSMLLLVVVGALVDLLILYSTNIAGLELEITYTFMFSCIICLWLVCNELISITENLRDMGIAIPVFLLPVLNLIKVKVEDSVKIEQDEKEGKNDGDYH
jgi:toxin secretion/phage lysis holin